MQVGKVDKLKLRQIVMEDNPALSAAGSDSLCQG